MTNLSQAIRSAQYIKNVSLQYQNVQCTYHRELPELKLVIFNVLPIHTLHDNILNLKSTLATNQKQRDQHCIMKCFCIYCKSYHHRSIQHTYHIPHVFLVSCSLVPEMQQPHSLYISARTQLVGRTAGSALLPQMSISDEFNHQPLFY